MYNTNDVGTMAIYGLGIFLFLYVFGLAEAGAFIVGLVFIIAVSLMLAK